jgi:predicted adenylyl cyclase CyaB
MARNVEIKARVTDLDAVRCKVLALASRPPEIIDQTDTFFVVPRGRLKVRAFRDGTGELIFYERADVSSARESIYTRVPCCDASALVDILRKVLPVRGAVIKRRELFLVGQTRIHLDDVPGLGCFVELEVVMTGEESAASGRQAAETIAAALGIADAPLVGPAYIDLFEGVTARS